MRFSRFVLVGGTCAFLNNVLFISFAHYGFENIAAALLAFGPTACAGYALHTIFTFQTSVSWFGFALYTLSMAANFPIWITALYMLCDLFGASVVIAAPASTGLVFLWNIMSAKWTFVVASEPLRPTFREALERRIRWR